MSNAQNDEPRLKPCERFDFDGARTLVRGPAYDGGRHVLIAICTGDNHWERAGQIVRAFNAHDALVEALQAFIGAAKIERLHPAWKILIDAGEAAIRQAEGETS